MSPEAENALFALFAVKLGLISESHVERALGKLEEGQTLAAALQASGKVSQEDAAHVLQTINPEVFPGYRIEAEAGRGGMGVVYRACQLSMDRPVALKVLTRRLSQDADYVEKFLVEARSAAKLDHEHIVAAIDAGSASELHYFAMEFVDGCTVADLLDEETKLPWLRAFEIGEQVARALGHAHQAGLVHRDVKPENVLVTNDGQAKLCDLGLAKPSQVAGTGEKADMTEGTPYYCSPEQALGRTDIDPKSDVYSLGVTIYTMIAGEPPFDGDSPRAILLKQVKEPFPELATALPEVPEPYRQLIADMVVKDRAQRLASAEVFAERLAEARREVTNSGRAVVPARSSSPIRPLAIGAGLLLAVALVIGLSLPETDPEDPTPSASPSVALASPGETPRGPVRVRTPRTTPLPGLGNEGLAQAKAAYAAAEAYATKNPQDAPGAAKRYAEVARAHPGTGYATRAEAEAERLEKEAGRSAQRALDSLSNRVLTLLNEQQFREAAELVETFRAAWKDRGDESVQLRLGRIDAQVKRQAESRAIELEGVLGKEPSNQAALRELQALAGLLPAESAKRARASLVGARRRLAGVQWAKTYVEVLQAFERGGAPAAQATLEGAQGDASLAAYAEQIRETLSDLAAADQAGRALDRAFRGLVSRGELSIRLATGEVLEGRFSNWEPRAGGQFQLKSGVQRTIRARDLAPEELLPWVLPPNQGRANAILLLGRGLPAAASLSYERYRKAGGKDVPLLAKRLETRRVAALEAAVKAALEPLLGPETDPALIKARLSTLPKTWRATAAFKASLPTLRANFVSARGAQLSKAPEDLFQGSCKVDRRGKATLSYDFSEPNRQGRDFRPSAAHHKGSEIKIADRAATFQGVVFVEARFLPGSLRVSYKVRDREPKAPNLNLLLNAGEGPWTGLLCGVGLSLTGIDSLKIDTQARKRAGYVVDLPAHALVQFAGKAPERRMPGVLAADLKPTLRGKTIRVTVSTSEKGLLKVKIGSRIPLNTPVPGLAQSTPNFVALAPLTSKIELIELELTGKLDPVWLDERARAIAAQEAAGL